MGAMYGGMPQQNVGQMPQTGSGQASLPNPNINIPQINTNPLQQNTGTPSRTVDDRMQTFLGNVNQQNQGQVGAGQTLQSQYGINQNSQPLTASTIDYNNLPAGIDAQAVQANPQAYADQYNQVLSGNTGQPAQPNVFQQSSQAYNDALSGTRAGMSVQPQDVMAARVQANQVGTNNILQGMSQYQNPFEQQVVDAALGDVERQRQMQINNVGSQATASGAFGGSRQGVAEAETNRAALDKSAQLAAQLRSQGFTQAADLAGRDIQNRQNVDLANQSANLNANTTTADQLMRSQLANQSNVNQYANRLLSGGAQMGNLSNLGFGFGNTLNQNQMSAGNQQQALMQQLINAGRGQFEGYSNSPQQSLDTLIRALTGSNQGQQTQTNSRNLGFTDIISAIAQFG